MRRRDFLTLAGVSAAMWPRSARAQQIAPRQLWVIGVLATNGLTTLGTFREALRALGYIEGQNVVFEVRDAAGNAAQLAKMASDLVSLKVDVIVAGANGAIKAAMEATTRIPIVMSGGLDAVASGYIASLAHPGGNVTGVTSLPGGLESKMLELFHEIKPGARRVAVLMAPPTGPGPNVFLDPILATGQAIGIAIQPVFQPGDPVDDAFATMSKGGAEAVIVNPQYYNFSQVAALALQYRIPSFAVGGVLARVGGFIGLNENLDERGKGSASYVDAILKGGNPTDLAVQQGAKVDLTLNMRTAKALGIEVPVSVIVRATEVIE